LARYEEMNFAQLRRFIHAAVERRSEPSFSSDAELPHSREDLYALCDMLQVKAEALKGDTTLPERPTYDGPPDPGYSFTPSEELGLQLEELERAEDRVAEQMLRGDHSSGSRDFYLEYIQDELKKLEQKIAPIEKREKAEYQRRLAAYRDAYEPHRLRVQAWRAEVENVRKRREAEADRDEMARRTYRKVKNTFDPKHASGLKDIGTVPWEILPPGERADEHVRGYYREVLGRGQLDGFDEERLENMLALPRSGWLKGTEGFYGYIILMFDHTEKVLMECPVRDNAIYVLDSGAERLLKMNKQQLIASDEAKRIFHIGDWYRRVKQVLEIE
jgi:hypothetical protein